MTNNSASNKRIYEMLFAGVYPLYVKKAERKGRTADEVDEVIRWLTGYDQQGLNTHVNNSSTFEAFFDQAPRIHPNASKITGVICGIRVEDIEDKLVQQVRFLDKFIDELANGRPMEKILRK